MEAPGRGGVRLPRSSTGPSFQTTAAAATAWLFLFKKNIKHRDTTESGRDNMENPYCEARSS